MATVVVVGSGNPVKLSAARAAFQRVFPDAGHRVEGVVVASGVPEQPRGVDETRRGARNRAGAAADRRPEADFWIGIEGGVLEQGRAMFAFARICVRSGDREGESATGLFRVPGPVAELVRAGVELGAADDEVFGTRASKRGQGAVGLLTGGAVDRAELYAQGVCLALAPFVHPGLYGRREGGESGG